MVHPAYPHVFEPIRLGPVGLPNRFYFAPHGTPLNVGTKPSTDAVSYYAERVADGGCGLVVASMSVHHRGRSVQASPYPVENVPALRALADAIHAAGGKIFAQIWYWWGQSGNWQTLAPQAPPLGPSAAPFPHPGAARSTHALSRAEIGRLIGVFRRSADHLRQAGFDGVMVHASHGAVAEQFLSPYFNRRTDEYGGSPEHRIRFLIESLEATREGAGDGLAVGIRLNCDELQPGGFGTDVAAETLRHVVDAGLVDFADLDVAVEPNQLYLGMPSSFVEPQVYRPYVAAVREAAGSVPVMSVLGRLTSVADAEAALASGVCDMVGTARALIAEPELVKQARLGHESRSRTCIHCNVCLEALGRGSAGCAINPASYRERLWGVGTMRPATRPEQAVVVVGGGPGGMEAARVASLRGHRVTLFEARHRLGGGLALWADIPGREWFTNAVRWWERELDRLGVDVRLGARATPHTVLSLSPDAVLVATGAQYSRSGRNALVDVEVPGSERAFVLTPDDILVGGARPSGEVAVYDTEGTHAGVGVAELLAAGDASVTYITPSLSPISNYFSGTQEARFVLQRLHGAGIDIVTASRLTAIGDGEIELTHTVIGEQHTSPHDAVILVTARLPVDDLAVALDGTVDRLYVIGDALAVRSFDTAAFEGHKFARMIGEPDAPHTVFDAYLAEDPADTVPRPADAVPADR